MEKLVQNIIIFIDGIFLAIKKLLFPDGAKLLLRDHAASFLKVCCMNLLKIHLWAFGDSLK